MLSPFVGLEQELQGLTSLLREVLPTREQRVLLTLDEASALARQSLVLALAHLVEGLAEVADDVELVEQDVSLRRVLGLERRRAERLPHVHHSQPDALAHRRAEALVELVHTGLGAVLATEPDGSPTLEIAHHDAVGVALLDGHLVDADHLGPRSTLSAELLPHVLLLQLLDRVPVEWSSLATSVIVEARHRRPTNQAKRLV